MKTIMSMVFAAAIGLAATAGQDNLMLTFSTQGPDTYADGTTVVSDGECYALVWVKKGATFAGFNADGTEVDPDTSRILTIVPYAENGHCAETVLEIDRGLADAYVSSGSFELHVLDTRGVDGVPKGDVAGGVKGYGAAAAFGLTANVSTRAVEGQMTTVKASTAALAATATALPPSVEIPKPVITSIKVENGIVRLKVKGTSPLLMYGVQSGDAPSDLAPLDLAAARADGVADAEREVEITFPADKGGRFFKIGRAPLK